MRWKCLKKGRTYNNGGGMHILWNLVVVIIQEALRLKLLYFPMRVMHATDWLFLSEQCLKVLDDKHQHINNSTTHNRCSTKFGTTTAATAIQINNSNSNLEQQQ